MKTALRLLPVLAACALLGACATTTSTRSGADAREAILKQRAQQRWDLLLDGQAGNAWDYLTPGYRNTVTREDYAAGMNSRPIEWDGATVNKVECASPDSCIVYVVVTYKLRLPGMGSGSGTGLAPLKERWLHLQDQWYYLPREEGGKSLKTAR